MKSIEEVQIDGGKVKGLQHDGIWAYKGIPYAAPPVSELRWKEPQPVDHWEGVRLCDSFKPSCPQPKSMLFTIGEASEDCLYLNVWTPAKSPDEKLPVMVWLHGGGFTTGTSAQSLYDGTNLARKGVVLVTVNYRLGVFGYLCHPLLGMESPNRVSGNYGLLDMIAALKWVAGNIEKFGGDPGCVTVFGQSSGAISILELMISPLAKGLFHRAISESGSFYDAYPMHRGNTMPEAEMRGSYFTSRAGFDSEDDVLGAMRAVPAEELVKVAQVPFHPVVDGWVIPITPSVMFASGKQAKVPLLVGTNADEGTMFVVSKVISSKNRQTAYENYVKSVYGQNAGMALETFPVDNGDVLRAMNDMFTQMGFAAGARYAALCQSKDNKDVYLYRFSRRPDYPALELLGTCHGLELPYVFGNFTDWFAGIRHNPMDLALSESIMSCWTNFARTGDPNGDGLHNWPAYTTDSEQYLELDSGMTIGASLYKESYPLVRKITGWQF